MNANWVPDPSGGDGDFHVQIVTDDDQQYVVAASPTSMAALVALVRSDAVLAWDPTNTTLIAANLVGVMPWTTTEASS